MSKPDQQGVPNWLLFTVFGSFVVGALYAIFMHGFLDYDRTNAYRVATGQDMVIGQPPVDAPARTPEVIASGEQIYQRACVACHGGNLEGGVGPALNDGEWLHSNKESDLYPLIVNGVGAGQSITGVIMPAKGGAAVSDQEIWHVVYYLSAENNSIEQDAEIPEQ